MLHPWTLGLLEWQRVAERAAFLSTENSGEGAVVVLTYTQQVEAFNVAMRQLGEKIG
jgi:hypothetical protein